MDTEMTYEETITASFSRSTLELLNSLLCAQTIPVGSPQFEEAVEGTVKAKRELSLALSVETE